MKARIGAFALAVAATGTLVATVALSPAQATTAPTAGQALLAAPVTTTNGNAKLIVDPTTELADTGAVIQVRGEGFGDDPGNMYVAVCPDSGPTPDLSGCVGGPIPGNTSPPGAWAHVVASGTGVNVSNWNNGSFEVNLALPSIAGGPVDCVSGKCALYTVGDGNAAKQLNNKVPLTFKTPTSSSSAPSTPSSAIVQQVGSPTIAPGATQSVIFSGFKAGEQVNLTLFSEPVTLSPVKADPTGVARVDFVVPADFVDGAHRLEAIGAESGTVGVASFQVLIPTPTPTPTPTPSPTPTPTPSPTSSSASSPATSSIAAPTTAVATGPADGDSGSSNWWIWLILGLVVLAGLITWFVVYRRNKEAARAEQEKQLADAAAREQTSGGYDPMADAPTMMLPPTNPPPGSPPPGADPYGLLSGRNHPYGVDPNAPTQFDQPGPTRQMPPGPTQIIGGPTQVIPPGQGPGQYGPPTGGMPTPGSRPDPAGPGRGGPSNWEVPPEFAGGPGPAEGPTGEGPTGEGTTGEGPTGEGPTGQGPTGEGPTGEGPTGEGPTGEGPTGQGPADQDQTDQGPRTAQFRPDFDDPDDPDDPAGSGSSGGSGPRSR